MPLMGEALAGAGISKDRVAFVCSSSSDYLAGQPFSFVMSLDAFGPWPPISESHVDMDGAWALYEAWVKIQLGKADIALVYAYGKSSPGHIRRVLTRQLDPYTLGPLWLDSVSVGALQARAGLDAGTFTAEQIAEVVASNRRNGIANPTPTSAATHRRALLKSPTSWPRCTSTTAPITDGAAVMILAADDVARELSAARRGSAASTTASRRPPSACATSPVRSRPSRPAPRPAWPTARSTSPSCTPRSPTRS